MNDPSRQPARSEAAASVRVALLTDSDVFAGTERHLLDLALGLRKLGVFPTVSTPRVAELAARAEKAAMPRLPIEKGGLVDFRAIETLVRALRRGDFEVLHAHNGRTQLSAALAVAIARRGACVFTQHFIEPGHTRRGGPRQVVFGRVHRFANAKTHRFIAISRAVEAAMLARGDAPAARIAVVPNGIGDPRSDLLDNFQGLGGGESRDGSLKLCRAAREKWKIAFDAPLLVCVARLAAEKDHATLLQAFAGVRRTFPHARLCLAGDGVLKSAMKRQIEALRLGDAAQLLGFVADVPALIAAADVLVLPAPREPFGLVFLEAMALEKPVVACNGGAAPEIVIEGETGLLFPPHDVLALQKALETLLGDPLLARRMGKVGRARFSAHFTRDSMARRTLDTYQHALDFAGGRA